MHNRGPNGRLHLSRAPRGRFHGWGRGPIHRDTGANTVIDTDPPHLDVSDGAAAMAPFAVVLAGEVVYLLAGGDGEERPHPRTGET